MNLTRLSSWVSQRIYYPDQLTGTIPNMLISKQLIGTHGLKRGFPEVQRGGALLRAMRELANLSSTCQCAPAWGNYPQGLDSPGERCRHGGEVRRAGCAFPAPRIETRGTRANLRRGVR